MLRIVNHFVKTITIYEKFDRLKIIIIYYEQQSRCHSALFLQEVVYHLVAVLAEVWIYERHMHPIGALRVVLPDKLVEWQMVADIIEPLAALLDVAIDAEVCRLTLHVLRVVDTADGLVQSFAAESAAYLDGFLHGHP